MTTETPLPYRPNAGIVLFNKAGLVFAGRSHGDGPETVRDGFEWQMPQGGIDPGEDLVAAARRELMEETSITEVSFLAETEAWWSYDFPPYSGPWHHLCAFRGQTQRWVAFRFEGREEAINVTEPIGGVRPEFFDWAWLPLASLPARVMPHKRANYERVVEAFGRFAAT
jgi:putative (di)nucleoside polyphosphate hydrolase